MIREQIENVANWSTDGSGVVQFRYDIGRLKFVFNVRPGTIGDVLREIERLADDKTSPMTWDDAAYLTALIRDVMDMLVKSDETCNCDQCVSSYRSDVAWSLLMFVCSAAVIATAAVFVLWGM